MYRIQTAVAGTSAHDLERLGALPEILEEPPRRRQREETAPPSPETKARVQARAESRARARQGISAFAVFGFLVVFALLAMVVYAHMYLALISSEIVQLEGRIVELQEDGARLQVAYGHAFSQVEIERFAREELGMMEAARGQVFHVGDRGDRAEILLVESMGEQGLLGRLSAFFGSLLEYLPFLS